MIASFTGTRKGMTPPQKLRVRLLLRDYHALHHGDCIGADEQAHKLGRSMGTTFRMEIHPPTDPMNRAFCDIVVGLDIVHPQAPYGVRDQHIVDAGDMLFATPKLMCEELRSGTWQTVRYARKMQKAITIIWPDGSLTHA